MDYRYRSSYFRRQLQECSQNQDRDYSRRGLKTHNGPNGLCNLPMRWARFSKYAGLRTKPSLDVFSEQGTTRPKKKDKGLE